ncbi:hypothetical protein [Burkholderia thailandensis]|uniref:hypothetical protein n=1 Tax=Burkholderia thailandensis TaxID=57975 RepID=UPI0009E3830D|nr:hypothetical protein [Burkholderia thailandensis]PNE76467.1 hypothetical protein A8H37_14080 [Burkholderia thailandensis]
MNNFDACGGPGRSCPPDYRYDAATFARQADLEASTLYVVGGLYGNRPALDAIELMASLEGAVLVFNGDFHWFDRNSAIFSQVDSRVRRHPALRGNIETELSRVRDLGAGCGCAYPPEVAQQTVDRSNAILRELRRAAEKSGRQAALADLPMTLVAQVGRLRVGVVHGDCESLAGWRFSADALDRPDTPAWLEQVRRQSRIDVFAASHTCLPAMRSFDLPSGPLVVANNGAAGMPNFARTTYGVVTRIGMRPSRRRPLHRVKLRSAYIEALALDFDYLHWHREFLSQWPSGSDAWLSYWERIVAGPDYSPARAYPGTDPLVMPCKRGEPDSTNRQEDRPV